MKVSTDIHTCHSSNDTIKAKVGYGVAVRIVCRFSKRSARKDSKNSGVLSSPPNNPHRIQRNTAPLPPPFLIGRLRNDTRCRQRSERAKRSARLFRVIYEVVSSGTAMGQARLTIASLKTVIATRPSRVRTAAFIPTNPISFGRCIPARTTAFRVSSGARGLRPSAGRKDTNVQQMLIDASHPEETRVIVTRGNKIEEFDFESEHKKQLKGNIYLARVTRVEPSLQAAFVEYGGNRHGFLAFSEIHPDYYQIPVADRLALLEAEAKAARSEDDEDEPKAKNNDRSRRNRRRGRRDGQNGDSQSNVARNGVPAAEPVGPAFENYVPGTPAIALMKQAGHVISKPSTLTTATMMTIRTSRTKKTWLNRLVPRMRWKNFLRTAVPIAVNTTFRKSSSGARSFWCRWSRKSAAIKALL